jgi:hypothetical protein
MLCAASLSFSKSYSKSEGMKLCHLTTVVFYGSPKQALGGSVSGCTLQQTVGACQSGSDLLELPRSVARESKGVNVATAQATPTTGLSTTNVDQSLSSCNPAQAKDSKLASAKAEAPTLQRSGSYTHS